MALLEGSKRVATVQYCVLRTAPPTCIELAAKIESGQGGYLTYRVPKDWMYIFVQQSLSKCDKYRHSSHASRVSGEFSLSPAVAWQLQSTECREAGWSHLSPWAPLISTCASSFPAFSARLRHTLHLHKGVCQSCTALCRVTKCKTCRWAKSYHGIAPCTA